jgi:hypothetical protein
MQNTAKIRIVGKARVVNRLIKTSKETSPEVVVRAGAGVLLEHCRVSTEGAVLRGPAEHFTQVAREPLEMLGVTRMGEGMIENGIGEAPSIEGGGERQERVTSAYVLIDAFPLDHGFIMSSCVIGCEG